MMLRRTFLAVAAVILVVGLASPAVVPRAVAGFTDAASNSGNVWATASSFTGTLSSITAASAHTCGLDQVGDAWCWGSRTDGRLGDGLLSPASSPVPVRVAKPAGMGPLAMISTLSAHTCAVEIDGQAWCWGQGLSGRLGDGATTYRASPVEVVHPTGRGWQGISAGVEHTCAYDVDGKAWCWGQGGNGQLGGSGTSSVPMAVSTDAMGTDVSDIAAADTHSCAIDAGVVWCWGNQSAGKLGDGVSQNSNQLTPVPVSGPLSAGEITAGRFHTCAIGADGITWCWGDNTDGRLGNGATNNKGEATPVRLASPDPRLATVDGGYYQTCGVDVDGAAWCWGGNGHGQLGDGTQEQRLVPTQVVADTMGTDLADIATGEDHSCAVDAAGNGWCWGRDSDGRLGSQGTGSLTPRQVDPLE